MLAGGIAPRFLTSVSGPWKGISMRAVRSLVVLFAAAIAVQALPLAAQQIQGRVVGVTDGDTIKVLVSGLEVTVRIWGIDAPEMGAEFSNVAKLHLSSLVFEKQVQLVQKDTDRDGRTVAQVSVDGTDVGESMVRDGLAWHYAKYSHNDPALARAEAAARAANRNIWTLPNPIPPWEQRAVQETVQRAQETQSGGIVYHGNTSSKIFHSPSCRYYTCKNCTRNFSSRDAAIAAGYRPCKVCRP